MYNKISIGFIYLSIQNKPKSRSALYTYKRADQRVVNNCHHIRRFDPKVSKESTCVLEIGNNDRTTNTQIQDKIENIVFSTLTCKEI